MIEIAKDKKSQTWIITKTDNEGFHRQMNVTFNEMNELVEQTAVDVCKKSKERVAALQAIELETLYESEKVTHQERIKALSSLMRKTREEIDKRDLSDVPTEKLIDLYLKQASALKDEIIEPNFKSSEEQERDKTEREILERLTNE